MRLLHFADLHLGMENYGTLDTRLGYSSRVRDYLAAFDQVVDHAIEHRVDAVLFAGDAFKHRDPSPTIQREFAKRIRRLAAAEIPTVLLVGNHSGGNLSPDSGVFVLSFSAYFGVERPLYVLAHNLVVSWPGLGFLRRFGVLAASHQSAEEALDAGAAVLVYPGGDREVHRPVWERNVVDFGGRKGWVELALAKDVPVVPVVAAGGQETALFLSRGERLARALGLDRWLRTKVVPISIAIPWGLNVGDLLGHVPLPAKITIEVLDPIDLRATYGPDPDPDAIYDDVVARMQRTLDFLYARRRLPVIG